MFVPVWISVLTVGLVITRAVDALNVQQQALASAATFDTYDAGLFTPVEDLGLLSTSDFTTLGHPLFPNYNVRIKKSDFCDGTVR